MTLLLLLAESRTSLVHVGGDDFQENTSAARSDFFPLREFHFSETEFTGAGNCTLFSLRLLAALQLNSPQELPSKPILTLMEYFEEAKGSQLTRLVLNLWLEEQLSQNSSSIGVKRLGYLMELAGILPSFFFRGFNFHLYFLP